MSDHPQNATKLRADIEDLLSREAWMDAADGLIDLAELVDDAEERYELYAQAADLFDSNLGDTDSANAVRVTAAEVLADELGRLEDAIIVYQIVLAADARNEDALEGLEALYGETEDWHELLALFERRAEVARDDDERVEMYRKQALILQEVVRDANGAAGAWNALLAVRPNDQEAAAALERLYMDGGRWAPLVAFYLAQSERVSDADAVDYLIRAAQVQQEQLESNADAIDTWQLVLKREPGNERALAALERLYVDADDTARVIDVLEKKISSEPDEETRLQLLVRLGDLHWHENQDKTGAISGYERALGIRKHYVPAIDALIGMFVDLHDWEMAGNTLQLKLHAVHTPSMRAEVHLELAKMMTAQTGSADFGVGHLEAAVELAPENGDALLALGNYYFSCEQWAKTLPLMNAAAPLLHKIRDREALADLHAKAGRCSEELLDPEHAIESYEASVRLVKPTVDMLWRLAMLCHEEEMFQESQKYLQRLDAYYKEELSAEQKSSLTVMLSEAAKELGKMTLAVNIAAAAEMLAPTDAEGFRRLIPILEARGKIDQVLDFKERLYALVDSDKERAGIAIEIAEAYTKHRGDLMSAMDWYRNAISLQPGNKSAAFALLEMLIKRGEFEEAIKQLEGLAAIETAPKKKSRWLMSIAAIYADELRDHRKARDYYERVLDADPSNLEAFQGLDAMLGNAGQWKELERSYRRMIQRITKRLEENASDKRSRKLLFMLYRNLGEIYRTKMERAEYAISSYEMALKYSPADVKTRYMLAKLCVRTPNHTDKAIENYRFLVRAYPDQFEHYHKLSALYTTTGQMDRAWSTAGLLRILGKAHEAEDRMYDKFAPGQLAQPRRAFDEDIWFRYVMTQKEDPAMGQLFQFLYALLGPALIFKPHKAIGLGKADRVSLKKRTAFAVALQHSSAVLGIPAPEVFTTPKTAGLKLLKTQPMGLAVSPKILASKSVQGLGFHVAKRIVYCSPWHVMAGIYDANMLHAFFMAAATLVNPKFPVLMPANQLPTEKARHVQVITEIRTKLSEALTPKTAKQLTELLKAVRNPDNPNVIQEWHRAIELTANRAALVVANDVDLVGRIVKGETVGMSSLTPQEKLKDLFTYVLGDRFAGVRRHLGIALNDR